MRFIQYEKDKIHMDNIGLHTVIHGSCTGVNNPWIKIIHDLYLPQNPDIPQIIRDIDNDDV